MEDTLRSAARAVLWMQQLAMQHVHELMDLAPTSEPALLAAAAAAAASAGEVPAALLAGVAVDSIGRRITVGSGLLLTGLTCCACSLLPPGWLTVALASAGKACCSGTWTVSYVYAAEIFPTYIRSVALAGTNQASRLGGVIAPGILYASERLGLPAAAPFAAVGAAALLTAALLSMLPETMGQPQPDSMADLDRLYGKHHSNSSSSSDDDDLQSAGMWVRIKAKYLAAGAGPAGAAGRQAGTCSRPSVSRQGSKLQRLLSRMSSSGGRMGRHSSSWAIPAAWLRSSSSIAGRSEYSLAGTASWQTVSTEGESLAQQQGMRSEELVPGDSLLSCQSSCQAGEAGVLTDMEMGVLGLDAAQSK
jgi:MFS family permease